MKKSLPFACAAVLALSSLSATAFAQEAEEEDSSGLSGTFAVTNDYVFRGISQTNEDPAFQAGLTYTTSFGLYVGTWASMSISALVIRIGKSTASSATTSVSPRTGTST